MGDVVIGELFSGLPATRKAGAWVRADAHEPLGPDNVLGQLPVGRDGEPPGTRKHSIRYLVLSGADHEQSRGSQNENHPDDQPNPALHWIPNPSSFRQPSPG